MSNITTRSLMIALALSVVLTGLSYFVVRNGQQVICAPATNGPLDEIGLSNQKIHGFPLAYYDAEIADECYVAGNFETNGKTYRFVNLGINLATWFFVSFMLVRVFGRPNKSIPGLKHV